MFAYYSLWIPWFSDPIHPLAHKSVFPLPDCVKRAFETLNSDIQNAAVTTVEPNSFIETNVSHTVITTTLNQNGKPVAFCSRTLSFSGRSHSTWERGLCCRRIRPQVGPLSAGSSLYSDQRPASFMHVMNQRGRIKNDKIQRWKPEFSPFQTGQRKFIRWCLSS